MDFVLMLYLRYKSMSKSWKMKPYRTLPLCVSQVCFSACWEFRSAVSILNDLFYDFDLETIVVQMHFPVCFHTWEINLYFLFIYFWIPNSDITAEEFLQSGERGKSRYNVFKELLAKMLSVKFSDIIVFGLMNADGKQADVRFAVHDGSVYYRPEKLHAEMAAFKNEVRSRVVPWTQCLGEWHNQDAFSKLQTNFTGRICGICRYVFCLTWDKTFVKHMLNSSCLPSP